MQQFDLFTFAATIVNFLILVALLRIFLYKRVVKAVEDRQARIENRWNEAETAREDAERSRQEYREKTEELEEDEHRLKEEARRKAADKEEELVNRAKREVEERKREWIESLEREKERTLRRFRQTAAEDLMTALRRILADLADVDLERAVVDRFLEKLNGGAAADLEEAERIIVRTGFSMPKEFRNDLLSGIEEKTGVDLKGKEISFETDEDLVLGIEIEARNKKIAWNVGRYIREASDELSKQLKS
jgi:F-type H+-transporting ATPase subunit b